MVRISLAFPLFFSKRLLAAVQKNACFAFSGISFALFNFNASSSKRLLYTTFVGKTCQVKLKDRNFFCPQVFDKKGDKKIRLGIFLGDC